jgi:SAM-dependent methyltransferase
VSFDRLAAHYRWIEVLCFGNALQRARTHWLKEIPRPSRALIIGEGNGRFLCELLRAYPDARVDCVDASASMLRITRGRVERLYPESLNHVRFLQRDILQWLPAGDYDLLVTHFVLDCFRRSELQLIISKLAAAACPGAVWLLADFALPSQSVARLHAQAWLRTMYAFFRLAAGISAHRLADPTSFLVGHNLAPIQSICWRWGMIKSQLWQERLPVPNSLEPANQGPDVGVIADPAAVI